MAMCGTPHTTTTTTTITTMSNKNKRKPHRQQVETICVRVWNWFRPNNDWAKSMSINMRFYVVVRKRFGVKVQCWIRILNISVSPYMCVLRGCIFSSTKTERRLPVICESVIEWVKVWSKSVNGELKYVVYSMLGYSVVSIYFHHRHAQIRRTGKMSNVKCAPNIVEATQLPFSCYSVRFVISTSWIYLKIFFYIHFKQKKENVRYSNHNGCDWNANTRAIPAAIRWNCKHFIGRNDQSSYPADQQFNQFRWIERFANRSVPRIGAKYVGPRDLFRIVSNEKQRCSTIAQRQIPRQLFARGELNQCCFYGTDQMSCIICDYFLDQY